MPKEIKLFLDGEPVSLDEFPEGAYFHGAGGPDARVFVIQTWGEEVIPEHGSISKEVLLHVINILVDFGCKLTAKDLLLEFCSDEDIQPTGPKIKDLLDEIEAKRRGI